MNSNLNKRTALSLHVKQSSCPFVLGSTTTQNGLTISAELDTNIYPKGIRISDEELKMVNLTKATFHGEWNYTIASNCSG